MNVKFPTPSKGVQDDALPKIPTNVLDEKRLIEKTALNETDYYPFATQTEIAPRKILIGIETENIKHGTKIPEEVWEPLSGGETLSKFWDETLKEPGDKIRVKGSTCLMLVFGGYVMDKITRQATPNLRSDIDVEVADPTVLERIKDVHKLEENEHAQKITHKDLTIDVIDQETIRRKINEAATHLKEQLEKQTDNPHAQQLAQLFEASQQMTEKGVPETNIIVQNSFYKQTSLSIALSKNAAGEIQAHLEDPLGVLDETRLLMLNIDEQKRLQQETGTFVGFLFRNQNPASFYQNIIEAANHIPALEFVDEDIPYFTAQNIGRLIRADCELNIAVFGDPMFPNSPQPYYRYYYDIVNFAGRLAYNHEVFVMVDKNGDKDEEKTKELKEKIIKTTQKEIARSAFSDPVKALHYTFEYLPIGNFISEEIAKEFLEMRNIFPHNNTLDENLENVRARSNRLPEGHDIKALRTFLRIKELAYAYYEEKRIKLHDTKEPTRGEKPYKQESMYKYELARPPANMSEVMALLFVASKWDEREDINKIEEVVEKWKVTGKLGLTWKRQEDADFKIGINVTEIVESMKKFKAIEKELYSN